MRLSQKGKILNIWLTKTCSFGSRRPEFTDNPLCIFNLLVLRSYILYITFYQILINYQHYSRFALYEMGWKCHMMSSYLLFMTLFTNGAQALQNRWKKRVRFKCNNAKKLSSFGHIPWEYLGKSMNFSADPRILCNTNCYLFIVLSTEAVEYIGSISGEV